MRMSSRERRWLRGSTAAEMLPLFHGIPRDVSAYQSPRPVPAALEEPEVLELQFCPLGVDAPEVRP